MKGGGRAGLVVALALGGLVRWTPPARVADLRPRPDALEYEEAARNLAHGEGYCLRIAGGKYPPRYPIGFSLLLVPAVALADRPGAGVRVVWVSALAAVAAAWWLGRAAGDGVSGTAAALLTALAPLHVRWSRAVMSDVPASAAVALLAVWVVSARARRARAVEWAVLGAAAGLAAALRPALLATLVPIAALLAVARDGAALVALAGGAALAVAACASALFSGYQYWEPGAYFAWRWLLGPPAGGGTAPNLLVYGRALAGAGELWPWPVALLVAGGALDALRRPGPPRTLAVLGLGTLAALVALHLAFMWQATRFLVPALPLALTLGGLPLRAEAPRAVRAAAAALALAALVVVARTPNAFAPAAPDTQEPAALAALADAVEPDATVMLHTNPFFFERFLRHGADRRWVPLGLDEHRLPIAVLGLRPYALDGRPSGWVRDAIDMPLRPAAAEQATRALLADGRPLYLSTLRRFEVPFAPALERLLAERFAVERRGPDLLRIRARD